MLLSDEDCMRITSLAAIAKGGFALQNLPLAVDPENVVPPMKNLSGWVLPCKAREY